jgi:hypothetical protein
MCGNGPANPLDPLNVFGGGKNKLDPLNVVGGGQSHLLGKGVLNKGGPPASPDYAAIAESSRLKAEAEATAAANQQLLADARRKRAQKGLLATEAGGSSVLSSGASPTASTVLGSGGA